MDESGSFFSLGGTCNVGRLIEQPLLASEFRLVAGAVSLERLITHPRIQKSGLVLVGHHHGVEKTRIQVFGETELSFLESLEPELRTMRCKELFELQLSLVIVTCDADPPRELVDEARRTDTPLVVSRLRSSKTILLVHHVLDELLAPTTERHGVLIEVHGVGMLIAGPSGIGKSECALSLLDRGHRFVADDRVVLARTPWNGIVGSSPPKLRHHLEVRGVGILNVRDLFGTTSVRNQKRLDLIVELVPWNDDTVVDRLGVDDETEDVLGAEIPRLRVPVQPGRNMAVILEVAARNQLIKATGRHPAREFLARLADGLSELP